MKTFIIIGSLFMALTVMTGAFGAHNLKEKLSMDYMKIFEKGVQYQAYHSMGLILLGLLGFNFPQHLLWFPALCFVSGIVLFSGSLTTSSIPSFREYDEVIIFMSSSVK